MQQQTLISSSTILLFLFLVGTGITIFHSQLSLQNLPAYCSHWSLANGHTHTNTNATGYTQRCCSWKKHPVYERSLVAYLPALKDCYLVISIKCFQPTFWGSSLGLLMLRQTSQIPSSNRCVFDTMDRFQSILHHTHASSTSHTCATT